MGASAGQGAGAWPRRRSAALMAAARRFAARRAGRPPRTGAVRLASWLLGGYGLFVAMITAADAGGSPTDWLVVVLLAGPLLGGAAALRWGRLAGYWIGLAVAALLVAAAAVLAAADPGAAAAGVLVVVAVPLVLLLVRGDRFDAWRRVWGSFAFMVTVGAGFTAASTWRLATGDRGGLAGLLFGLAVLALSPAFRPRRGSSRRRPPPPGRGFRERWWFTGPWPLVAGAALMGLAGLAMAVLGAGSARHPHWYVVAAGGAAFVFFGAAAVVLTVRGLRDRRVRRRRPASGRTARRSGRRG